MESFEFVNGSFKVKLISLQSGVVKLSLLTYVIFLLRYVEILQTLFQNKRGSIHLQKWISANCQPGILINTCLHLIHSVSNIVSVFASCRMVVSFSSPFPAYQPTPDGHCHVAMYISPDLQLLVIMIEYATYDRSLSTHLTVWVFTFSPLLQVCKGQDCVIY